MTNKEYHQNYVIVKNSQGQKYLGKLVREDKNWLGRINARIYECYNIIGERPFAYLAVYKGTSGPLYMAKNDFPEEHINAAVRRARQVYRGRERAKRQAARQSKTH